MDLTDYLTTAQAAALTGAAVPTWTNRARAGRIPGAVRVGRDWLLPREAVLAFVPAPTGKPRDATPSPAALYRRAWRERRGG